MDSEIHLKNIQLYLHTNFTNMVDKIGKYHIVRQINLSAMDLGIRWLANSLEGQVLLSQKFITGVGWLVNSLEAKSY